MLGVPVCDNSLVLIFCSITVCIFSEGYGFHVYLTALVENDNS